MSTPEQPNFWGYLYAWRPQLREQENWFHAPDLQCDNVETSGWIRLTWKHSSTRQDAPPVLEQFFLRLSKRRFVLLGPDAARVPILLRHTGIEWKVVKPPIDVHRVAVDLVARPAEYCLGGVWARVEGHGQALRTVGLFGTDLAEAVLFRDLMPHLACNQIRLRDVRRSTEVIVVGSRGDIGLRYSNSQNLIDATSALGFLSKRGYIEWQDPNQEQHV